MSFFGFDPSSNPHDRSHPSKNPGFSAAPDAFAGLSQRPSDDDDDGGIDFEDTYDGLGDQLDETDDALNDDTFGGGDEINREFDFHGNTAAVANVIEEEHEVFSRSAGRKQSTPTTVHPTKTGYEKYAEPQHSQSMSMVPDMSLWGAAPAPPVQQHQQTYAPMQESMQATAPGGKKFLSLDEVEAQLLAMNQRPQQQQEQQHQPQFSMPMHMPPQQHPQMPQAFPQGMPRGPPQGFPQGLPPMQMQPGQQHNFPPQFGGMGQPSGPPQMPIQIPPGDMNQFHALPPHMQQMMLRNQQAQQQQHQQQQHHQQQQQQQPPQPQFADQMQRPPMPPVQAPPGPGVLHQSMFPPLPSQGGPQHVPQRNQYGMAPHAPAPQLQNMTEAERDRFMEEEAKRLRRNHKIAQLARYNGLMSPQDKNFITRIQLQQLVSVTNPESQGNEDFYYIVHSAIRARANPQQPLNQFAQTYLFRQGGRQGNRRQDNHNQRLEQQVVRAVAAAKARPKASQLVLEGSLGKISFSNVKTPRPMLNIKKSEGAGEQVRKARAVSSVDRKSLLKIIENVYDALLELEVHERERTKIPITQPGQPRTQADMEWQTKREELVQKLWVATKILEPIDQIGTHPFISILSFSKMKRAIPRIFRHLEQEHRLTVLTMIVIHLDKLDVIQHGVYLPMETQLPSAAREEIDAFSMSVLPPLLSYVYEAPLNIVIGLINVLLDRVNIYDVSRTKIGLAFLTMFTSRAEILKQGGRENDRDLQQWEDMYNRLFESLHGHWMQCFPPSGNYVDDVYVWQFLASMAVGANMHQQQVLVAAVKDRVMENVMASKTLPPELGAQKSANVNLFMRAMGLDVELLG